MFVDYPRYVSGHPQGVFCLTVILGIDIRYRVLSQDNKASLSERVVLLP